MLQSVLQKELESNSSDAEALISALDTVSCPCHDQLVLRTGQVFADLGELSPLSPAPPLPTTKAYQLVKSIKGGSPGLLLTHVRSIFQLLDERHCGCKHTGVVSFYKT